jgi:heme exporter protein D
MIWGSLEAFLAMGGYGVYVWGSMGACFVMVCVELIMVRRRHNRILRRLTQELSANQGRE